MPRATKHMVHVKNVRPKKLLTSLFVIMLCMSLFTSQVAALVAPVTVDGNPKLGEGCVRIDDPEDGIRYTIDSEGVKTNPEEGFKPADFWIDIELEASPEGQLLSFKSKYPVTQVVVKGGDKANVYTFSPAIEAGDTVSGLHAPVNSSGKYADVSHIDICFGEETPPPANPAIDIKKYVSVDGGKTWEDANTEPGPTLDETKDIDPQYKIVVTNTGNVDLTGIDLKDPMYQSLIPAASVPATLAKDGEGKSFTIIFTAPWAAGLVCNTATVTGKYNDQTVTDADTACYTGKAFEAKPGIDVEKHVFDGEAWVDADSATGPELLETDGKVKFRFVVKNTGNVQLTEVTLADSDFEIPAGQVHATLDPGESFTVEIEAPWSEGQHENTATATGKHGGQTYTDTDKAHYFGLVIAIGVVKTVSDTADGSNPDGAIVFIKEGDKAYYRVVVTNTSNVALKDVILTDDFVKQGTVATIDGEDEQPFVKVDGKSTLNLGTLDPMQAVVVTYQYETSNADVGEQIDNTATATGTYKDNQASASDTATIFVEEDTPLAVSGIKLEKWVENMTAGGVPAEMAIGFKGDTFRYTIKVTNTGETDLTNVVVHDSFAKVGSAVSVTIDGGVLPTEALVWANDGSNHAKLDLGVLPAGAVVTITYLYTADEHDEGKTLTNIAHVTAEFEGIPLESSDTAVIAIQETPPQTGESDGKTLGMALLLTGAVALLLRRKLRLAF